MYISVVWQVIVITHGSNWPCLRTEHSLCCWWCYGILWTLPLLGTGLNKHLTVILTITIYEVGMVLIWTDMETEVLRATWKRLWCWEGLGAGGEGDDRGWDGWMASLTRWTWVSVNSGSWWWTGRPGVLRFMGSQRVGHDWATELIWSDVSNGHLPQYASISLQPKNQYTILSSFYLSPILLISPLDNKLHMPNVGYMHPFTWILSAFQVSWSTP